MKKQEEIAAKFNVEIKWQENYSCYEIVADEPLWVNEIDNLPELTELGEKVEAAIMEANHNLPGLLLGSFVDASRRNVCHLPVE